MSEKMYKNGDESLFWHLKQYDFIKNDFRHNLKSGNNWSNSEEQHYII